MQLIAQVRVLSLRYVRARAPGAGWPCTYRAAVPRTAQLNTINVSGALCVP